MNMICTVESVGMVGDTYVQIKLTRPFPGFPIVPGQYVTVTAGGDTIHAAVTNFHDSERRFDLLIAPGNNHAGEALRACKIGDQFQVSVPIGKGFPPPRRDGYILIAGGSGISSIMSVVDWAACNDVPVSLVYFDRASRFAYAGLLPLVTETSVLWDTVAVPRPDHPMMPLKNIDIEHRQICICGPNSLYNRLYWYLSDTGHDSSIIGKNY